MLCFKITTNNTLTKDIQESSDTFYISLTKLDNKMTRIYLYLYNDDTYITSYQKIDIKDYRLHIIGYVFPEWSIGFNLVKIKLPNLTFFTFKDKNQLELYPLSAIIWPPAIKYSNQIINLLKKHYQIVKLVKISLPNRSIMPFIYSLYHGDLKCDKSQLPIKKNAMERYPHIFIYIKFLIPKLDLNKDRVSKSAIQIKNIIRKLIKPYINNYIYDIIFHVSDNLRHSINMEKSVKRQNKNTQLINVT